MLWVSLLIILLALSACGGRHVWVDDGFFAPQAYQWCERHRTYHPVNKIMGISGKKLTKAKVWKM